MGHARHLASIFVILSDAKDLCSSPKVMVRTSQFRAWGQSANWREDVSLNLVDTNCENLFRPHPVQQIPHPLYGCNRESRKAGLRAQAETASRVYTSVSPQLLGILRDLWRHPNSYPARKAAQGLGAYEEGEPHPRKQSCLAGFEQGLVRWETSDLAFLCRSLANHSLVGRHAPPFSSRCPSS